MDSDCLNAALSPAGDLCVIPDPEAPALPRETAARVSAEFARGSGFGSLYLGAAELSALPAPLAYFRDFARAVLVDLCSSPEPPARFHEARRFLERAPPMRGAEFLSLEKLQDLRRKTIDALDEGRGSTPAAEHLAAVHPAWASVGKVCVHLAERRGVADLPFALAVTYVGRLGPGGRPQHAGLEHALRERAGDSLKLFNVLRPLRDATERSQALKSALDSGAQTLTAAQAYRLLRDAPAIEEAGLLFRAPDFWRRARRVTVDVTVGAAGGGLGAAQLLDFKVAVALDGEELTAEDLEVAVSAASGLAFVKGAWAEVDARLPSLLKRWAGAAEGGMSFLEAVRTLAGTSAPASVGVLTEEEARFVRVKAGPALAAALAALRDPSSAPQADPGSELRATLRPYQQEGVRWLWLLRCLGLSGCLADDMGLGKTLQVLGLLVLRRRCGDGPTLLVVPASLLENWRAESARFAPTLRVLVAHPSALTAEGVRSLRELDEPEELARWDVVLTSYGYLQRQPALRRAPFDLIVLDEAQAIKNQTSSQARAVKELAARTRLALTGTPVENRLSDLWSIYDFLVPRLLGDAAQFGELCKAMAARGDYGPLRRLTAPYLLRRTKADPRVVPDLPEKTELQVWCGLSAAQAALYQAVVDSLRRDLESKRSDRRGLVLSTILRLKQVCNHPAQALGRGDFAPAESGKFARLAEVCQPAAERGEKVLVFTQFKEMTAPLAAYLGGVFGRPGFTLDGDTPVAGRQAVVDAFQAEDARSPPFLVLSLKVGGAGLNLTAASHVVHFDRWWNPAAEDQATGRAHRIGQRRGVLVHKFTCRGTLEERVDQMLCEKRALAGGVVGEGQEFTLADLDDEQVLSLVSLDVRSALAEVI